MSDPATTQEIVPFDPNCLGCLGSKAPVELVLARRLCVHCHGKQPPHLEQYHARAVAWKQKLRTGQSMSSAAAASHQLPLSPSNRLRMDYLYDRVGLIRTRREGTTVYALQDLPAKGYIFEYTGNPIFEEDADQCNIYLVQSTVRRNPQSVSDGFWIIDGSTALDITSDPSNASKLINTYVEDHDAHLVNCELVDVAVRSDERSFSRLRLPRAVCVVVRTTRAIAAGEMLCIDYGANRKKNLEIGRKMGYSSIAGRQTVKRAPFRTLRLMYPFEPLLDKDAAKIRWFMPSEVQGLCPNANWWLSFDDLTRIMCAGGASNGSLFNKLYPDLVRCCFKTFDQLHNNKTPGTQPPLDASDIVFKHPSLPRQQVISCEDVCNMIELIELHNMQSKWPVLIEFLTELVTAMYPRPKLERPGTIVLDD